MRLKSSTMRLLYMQEINEDISRLSKIWSEPPTFVFLASRSGVSKNWVEERMADFPEKFKTNHFVLLTSGTTGQPKLVIASRKRAEKLVRVIHEVQKNEPVKETIITLPLTYCYAFVNQWVWAKVFNRKLIFTPGFNQPNLLKEILLKANKAMVCFVASQIPLFIKHFGETISFPGIIRLNFAGAPFPQNNIEKIHRLFPTAKIFNNYGCAEAMPRLTVRSEKDSSEGSNVGKPLPGIKIKTDENSRIFFISPYSAVGFCDNYGFSVLRKDTWIPTGDLGEKLENGYWCIKGRATEVFKRFGEKIAISQLLKNVCSQWSGEAAFYKESDSNGEEGCILVLCPKPTEEQYRRILHYFRQNHPRTHWPLRLESADPLPLLENGKIDTLSLVKMKDKIIHWYQRT